MARTALTVNAIVVAGLADPAATTGTADGHKITYPSGKVFLEFNNANASARVVTIQTPLTVRGYAVADESVTIPGSASRFKSGVYDTSLFNRLAGTTDSGSIYLDYPAGQHTDITVRAFSV
jgi:hypothetical protein